MSGLDCMDRRFVNYVVKLEVKVLLVYAQAYNNTFQINWLKN